MKNKETHFCYGCKCRVEVKYDKKMREVQCKRCGSANVMKIKSQSAEGLCLTQENVSP